MHALPRTNYFRPMSGLVRNFRVRMVGAASVNLNSSACVPPQRSRAAEWFVAQPSDRSDFL